jgi:hypothetical protein
MHNYLPQPKQYASRDRSRFAMPLRVEPILHLVLKSTPSPPLRPPHRHLPLQTP